MRRFLFNLVSLLSLLVGIAAAVSWIRSYSGLDIVSYARQGTASHTLVGLTSTKRQLHLAGSVWDALGPPTGWSAVNIPFTSSPYSSYAIQSETDGTSTPVVRMGSTSIDVFTLSRLSGMQVTGASKFQFYAGPDQTGLLPMLHARRIDVVVPTWLAVLISLIVPFLWLRSFLRRVRPGTCRSCGYDLTGNTSGVCPECGTAISAAGAPTGGLNS